MSLLERFQAGSELDSVGEFTLDESKAREKMARFQLVTNEEFLMLVAQAAVAAQCSAMAITLAGSEVRLVATGALLDAESVRTIREFLFDSQSENVAYNLLAVAANAVEPSCQTPPLIAMVDEELHFEANLSSELRGLAATIKDRLAHLPCPLSLNGVRLATDPIGEEPRVELLEGGTSSITLIRYGVVVARQSKSLSLAFKAVAAANSLLLDASFSHVVEDDAYKAVLKALSCRANRELADFVCGQPVDGSVAMKLLPHFMADHPDPAGAALDAFPLFPLADRGGHISFADILAQVSERGQVMTAGRNYNLQLSVPVVRLDDQTTRQALQARLPARAFKNADSEYLAQAAAARNKSQWESSPRPTELPPGRYLCQAQVQGLTWEAAIGYLASPGGPGRVDVLYQGRLLANESLGDLPPGAAAVLNVRQGQVDPTWSRLDGREYRAICKELREKLRALFRQQTFSAPADLYPALRAYLLSELKSGKPPTVAKTAPLFPVLGQSTALTFGQVSALETVALGDPVTPFQRIPASALPVPLLEHSPERFQVLVSRLGAPRVIDFRDQQKRLRAIDREMANPKPATLGPGDYLIRRSLSLSPCAGEVGLLADQGSKLRVALMKHGVVFENLTVPGGRVLEAVAVVDVPHLELTPMWNGIARSTAYSKLLSDLSTEISKLEQELLAADLALQPELRIKLLRAYPQAKETYWEKPLLATTSYGTFATLSQLDAELDKHGHLLRGEPGIAVPGRIALISPSKEIVSFLNDGLNRPVTWAEASVALRAYQQALAFEEKSAVSRIALAGRYPVRLPLPSGRGEVVIQQTDIRLPGEVNCYVRGRFVCRKTGLIPSPFLAAVESEAFVLSSDFQDVSVPDSVKAMLHEICGQCMLQAAVHSDLILRNMAWEYFGKGNALSELKAKFQELVTLSKLDGEPVSLAAVASSKIQGYVGPKFSSAIPSQGLVLRLNAIEVERFSRYSGKSLNNVEALLLAQQRYRQQLESLPTQLPKKLYSKTFEDGPLKAILGVSMERRTVGLDAQGRPVGLLRQLHMPVQAIVHGAVADSRKGLEPIAELPSKSYTQLGRWADQLCLDWVKEKADDGQLIIHLLSLCTREIASRDDRPLSAMATILWDMPLFSRVDGTRVSGSALAAALTESKEPITVSAGTFRVPGSAIYLPEGSEELQILSGVLGKDSLRWYEAPPLVNAAEIGDSVKRLVSWGMAPLGKTWAAVSRLLERPKDKKEKKPAVKVRDPREVLIVQLKEDIRNLLGREHFRKSDELFKALDFGSWPLGPPIYRQRGGGPFRLNSLHAGVRWLLEKSGDERHKRAARMMLVVHWVGLVNVASTELTDTHEDEFLTNLAERLAQIFAQN
jgi:hypothetical protein